jgi:hypothetical protein
MRLIIKENIFNLFEEGEKIFETIINKLRDNEDIVFDRLNSQSGVRSVAIRYKPGFIVLFSNKDRTFNGSLSYDNETKFTQIFLKYRNDIFEELQPLKRVFIHEYSHYIQRINSKHNKIFDLPSKRKYKKMYLEPQSDDKFYLVSSERHAYINDYLYEFYNNYAIPMWERIKPQIEKLYLEGFYEIEDVEKMIQSELTNEFSTFYKTLPENIKAIFDGINQRNSRPQQRKYFLQVIRKITKRIIDQFLGHI